MQIKNKHILISQKRAYALFCVFISFSCFSQNIINLVNNYSAEQFTACPTFGGQVNKANFWFQSTVGGSSDYFNTCTTNTYVTIPINIFGTQMPRTGNAYLGLVTYGGINLSGNQFKEYLGNSLKQTLSIGKKYCITYYVTLAEKSRYATANIGIYLSKDSVIYNTTSSPFPIIPSSPSLESNSIITDTINWIKIEGTYVAIGTERFITLGNFRADATTTVQTVKPLDSNPSNNGAYYYLDDISVLEINTANAALKDTVFKCAAASFTLGTDSTEFATYSWQPATALSCTNCPNPIASPTATTKYYLTKVQCSSTTKDSVIVSIVSPSIANAGPDKIIACGGVTSIGVKDSTSFINYVWSPASSLNCSVCSTPIANPSITTTYYLTKQFCNLTTKDSVVVSISTPTTIANAGLDSTICLGDKIFIGTKDSLSFTNYVWQPKAGLSCTNCATPLVNLSTNTTYTLQRTECAFITSNDITITIDDCEPTYTVPNIFTPNYDGKNDTWGVIFSNSKYVKDFSVTVYDRWGLRVFESEPGISTPNLKWDGHTLSGSPCTDGVYFYVVSFTKNEESVKLNGSVTLYK